MMFAKMVECVNGCGVVYKGVEMRSVEDMAEAEVRCAGGTPACWVRALTNTPATRVALAIRIVNYNAKTLVAKHTAGP